MGGIKGNYYLRGELLVLLEGFENLLVLRIILRTSALSPRLFRAPVVAVVLFFFFFFLASFKKSPQASVIVVMMGIVFKIISFITLQSISGIFRKNVLM